MLRNVRETWSRRFVTLEERHTGRLRGDGDPSAISIDGAPGSAGVLVFHGFAGTPNEVRVVAEVAAKQKLAVRAPRLPGHTADARDLMRVGWNDWTEAAARALDELYECTGKPAIVAGLSLGSLLATHLAANFGSRVAGLAVMANATRLSLASRAPLWIFDVTRPFGNAFFMPKAGADIRDPSARERHLTYDVNPIKSAIEVMRAGRVVSAELGRVTCPTLVIHGRFDRVCPVANARRFADGLGTKDVEVRIMANSGHIVTSDWDRGDVARRLDAFLSRTAHVPRP